MAEWLYEEGIGEARAGLIEHGSQLEDTRSTFQAQ